MIAAIEVWIRALYQFLGRGEEASPLRLVRES
jgi:hypothetical protein